MELRSRLRVAVDADSPSWWRDASVDIVSRCKPLPEPGRAYLIATPSQMSGKPEAWDYGVGLPANELAAWQGISPALTIGVYRDKSIGPMKPDSPDARPLLILSTG
jgi:hypothetical protein